MASSDQLSKSTFLGINWLLYALCAVFFFSRLYIRWLCFRRLFVEDYLMVTAMAILTGIEAMSQRYSDSIYYLMAWVNGTVILANPSQFLVNTEAMLKACGSGIILFIVGFYFIKVNFLLFFYRMGNRLLRIYRIVWWIVFAIVLSCGIISITIGITTFKCLFDGILYTFTTCETAAYENIYFTYFRVSVALDIFTDALIIGFPVWLLWGIRINLRKKIALGGIFSLVGFTIVATILRGALLSEVFASTATGQTFNIPWVWFWFHIEFCIAFIVACLVSFRALFAHERPSSTAALRAQRQQRPSRYPLYPSGGSTTIVGQGSGNASQGNLGLFRKSRFKAFHDSLLDTCRTLEGVEDDRSTVEMDLFRAHEPDVVTEQGAIGGLRDMAGGDRNSAQSPRDQYHGDVERHVERHVERNIDRDDERDVERDSQGVSILDDAADVAEGDVADWPRRRDTMLTSQLSLDSLYMSRSSESAGRSGI